MSAIFDETSTHPNCNYFTIKDLYQSQSAKLMPNVVNIVTLRRLYFPLIGIPL